SPMGSPEPLARNDRPSLADLPTYVPPEPELRDHLGRMTAKTIETWERWYHQWHREIRGYNPNYSFNT
ncbi:MAG TPA: hypothetical protein VJ783_00810, partial [Pirellulales bacterium]|nr:hypothetical protein [Pirellulales bacterium]